MSGLNPFDVRGLLEYTNGQTSTTGRKRRPETYLRIDLGETIEYASIRGTIHRAYTLTKCTQVALIWPNSTILESIWSRLPAGEESKW